MPSPFPTVGRHVLASGSLLARRSVQVAIAVAAIATLLSIVLAPDTSPEAWDWLRFILIGCAGLLAVLVFASARLPGTGHDDRQQRLLLAGVLVGVALILNLTFSVGTTLLYSLGITVVTLLATERRDRQMPWIIPAALVGVIPFWVWSALDAWTWELLLLVPLAGIGVVSDGHMRVAVGLASDGASPLTTRAHRLASWLGVVGAGLIVLVVGMVTDADTGVAMLGAIGAVALLALEAGAPPASESGPRRSVLIVEAAFMWIALCWIVSL